MSWVKFQVDCIKHSTGRLCNIDLMQISFSKDRLQINDRCCRIWAEYNLMHQTRQFHVPSVSMGRQVSSTTTAALLFPRIGIIRTFHGILANFRRFFLFLQQSCFFCGKWLNLKGSYWRDPFFTSMKIGRKCKAYPFLVVFTKLFVSEERVASASFRVPSNVDRHEGVFSAQRSRDSTDLKNSTSFGRIPNSLSENLARQIEWYSICTLSKVCLFTTLMLLELQGSRRAVDISWLISKVGWIFGRFGLDDFVIAGFLKRMYV